MPPESADAGSQTDTSVESLDEGARKKRNWVVPVLAGLSVLMLALAVTFFSLWLSTADPTPADVEKLLSEEEPEIQDVSNQVAKLLFTYDSTTLDTVTEKMLSLSTSNFASDFEDLIVNRGLGDVLEKAKASSRGIILEGPDVSFIGPNEAWAVFNIRQTVQNKDNPAGDSFIYVTRLTLVKPEGQDWKADEVKVLSINEV